MGMEDSWTQKWPLIKRCLLSERGRGDRRQRGEVRGLCAQLNSLQFPPLPSVHLSEGDPPCHHQPLPGKPLFSRD